MIPDLFCWRFRFTVIELQPNVSTTIQTFKNIQQDISSNWSWFPLLQTSLEDIIVADLMEREYIRLVQFGKIMIPSRRIRFV